jgi:hypothetical protein
MSEIWVIWVPYFTSYSLCPVKNAILAFEKKSHKEYNPRK